MELTEAKLAFLDVETTGLSPAMGDRIIEIGIVVCRGQEETDRLSRLVNPERPIPLAAHRVHRISDQDVSECPPFKEIAEEVESTLIDSWIVGHNVRFDVGFIGMYDALTNGQELQIRYLNGNGQTSDRTIRPVACFPAGRYTYVRAHCSQAGEIRTFRVDRIVMT